MAEGFVSCFRINRKESAGCVARYVERLVWGCGCGNGVGGSARGGRVRGDGDETGRLQVGLPDSDAKF